MDGGAGRDAVKPAKVFVSYRRVTQVAALPRSYSSQLAVSECRATSFIRPPFTDSVTTSAGEPAPSDAIKSKVLPSAEIPMGRRECRGRPALDEFAPTEG
jgi:hypothetical protein